MITTGFKSVEIESEAALNQTPAWLRGLLTIAWVDGSFDPQEQEAIEGLIQRKLTPEDETRFQPITPTELASSLASDHKQAENFLRLAVMVCIVDGVYSASEDQLLHQFAEALGLEIPALKLLGMTLQEEDKLGVPPAQSHLPHLLDPVRHWLDGIEMHDPRIARFLCKLIPPQCPFERDITVFGHKLLHIPPMCKLNPLYEQLVGLRFRALAYLADECHEDVSIYC
uniref:Mo-dependent nitrogenase family protein n=1 Tax=Cyanothece sp. (strain PCC 7425 / ATCC 29141) TaxID=395961 RepID=B8HVL9_CYAP4